MHGVGFGEADDQRSKRGAQDERQIGIFLIDQVVADLIVAAHDGARAGIDAGGLHVGHDADGAQAVVDGDFDERPERWRRIQPAGLRQKVGRRRLDDFADQRISCVLVPDSRWGSSYGAHLFATELGRGLGQHAAARQLLANQRVQHATIAQRDRPRGRRRGRARPGSQSPWRTDRPARRGRDRPALGRARPTRALRRARSRRPSAAGRSTRDAGRRTDRGRSIARGRVRGGPTARAPRPSRWASVRPRSAHDGAPLHTSHTSGVLPHTALNRFATSIPRERLAYAATGTLACRSRSSWLTKSE